MSKQLQEISEIYLQGEILVLRIIAWVGLPIALLYGLKSLTKSLI